MIIALKKENLAEGVYDILRLAFEEVKKESDEDQWGTHCILEDEKDDTNKNYLFTRMVYRTFSGKGNYIIVVSRSHEDGCVDLEVEFDGYRNSFLGGTLGWDFKKVPQFPVTVAEYTKSPEDLRWDQCTINMVFKVDFFVNLEIHDMQITWFETSAEKKPLWEPDVQNEYTRKLQVLSRHDGGKRYRMEIPKDLADAMNGVKQIVGSFSLRAEKMMLRERYRVVTTQHLLGQWWDTHIPPERRDQIEEMDWDDLLATIGVQCPDCSGRDIRIGDFDEREGTVWIAFKET